MGKTMEKAKTAPLILPVVKLDSVPLQLPFLRKKLKTIQKEMQIEGIDMWITFTREGNEDPLAQDLRFGDLT